METPHTKWFMMNNIVRARGLVTTSFNYQKLKVETAMEETNNTVNSDMANSEDNNSLGNSMKTVIEENNIFINSDDKTDSEIVNSYLLSLIYFSKTSINEI